MEQEFQYEDYNWIYYVVGLVMGALTGFAVEGHVILGAVLGLLTGGLFKYLINKSRNAKQD
jgi:hypothetical protein